MLVAVAGIKYTEETHALIRDAIREKKLEKSFCLEKLNLAGTDGSTEISDHPDRKSRGSKILIFTDRDCGGIALRPDDCMQRIKNIISQIQPKDFVILNVDDEDLIRHLAGIKCHVITYGFNSKARITASSTYDDLTCTDCLCSLQGSITTKYGTVLEPGDLKIHVNSGVSVYSIMAYCGFLLVSGLKKPGE